MLLVATADSPPQWSAAGLVAVLFFLGVVMPVTGWLARGRSIPKSFEWDISPHHLDLSVAAGALVVFWGGLGAAIGLLLGILFRWLTP